MNGNHKIMIPDEGTMEVDRSFYAGKYIRVKGIQNIFYKLLVSLKCQLWKHVN